MQLNQITDNKGARKNRKRIGRGIGSGSGKTSGAGMKGQKSRSGVAIKGFEGGQMPLHRRLPKRGFNNIFRKQYQVINIGRLQKAVDDKKLDAKKPVDSEALAAAGLIRSAKTAVRLLAKGSLSANLNITVAGASKAAVAAVEGAGGSVTVTEVAAEKPAAEASA